MTKQAVYVEYLTSAHAGRIPWKNAAVAYKGRSERRALQCFRRLFNWYHPEPGSWSGHVRIVDNTHLLEATPGLPRITELVDA